MTDNHQYNTPTAGTIDWHVPLNANFEKLDTDIEIRDAEANRGQYVAKGGAKFFATDTGRVFIGQGFNWVPVGRLLAPGEVVSGGGLTMTAAGVANLAPQGSGVRYWDTQKHPILAGDTINIPRASLVLPRSDGQPDSGIEMDVRVGGASILSSPLTHTNEPDTIGTDLVVDYQVQSDTFIDVLAFNRGTNDYSNGPILNYSAIIEVDR